MYESFYQKDVFNTSMDFIRNIDLQCSELEAMS